MFAFTGRSLTRGTAAGGVLLCGILVACGATSASQGSANPPSGQVSPAAASAASASEGSPAVSQLPGPSASAATASTVPSSSVGPFTLESPAFHDGAAIPKSNTCDGADHSPELRWSNAPTGTGAFVLEMLDPDAHDWVHWLVLDIPGSASGSLPANVGTGSGAPQQGRNSFGKVGWGGPCPPSGTHHYVFTLFALDAALGLSGNPDRAATDKAMATHHVLAKATLTGTYRRG